MFPWRSEECKGNIMVKPFRAEVFQAEARNFLTYCSNFLIIPSDIRRKEI
jgi:hypothetical protein